MPFDKPHANSYKKFDLVYGLDSIRTKYSFNASFADMKAKDNVAYINNYRLDNLTLENSSPRFRTLNESYIQFMRSAGKFLLVNQNNLNTPNMLERKCKGGIAFLLDETVGINLHFLLDGINMHNVVYKTNKEKSITGAELRWIYRNRNNPRVQKVVQFWINRRPCCPPWNQMFHDKSIVSLWANYHPKSHNDNHEFVSLEFQTILSRAGLPAHAI